MSTLRDRIRAFLSHYQFRLNTDLGQHYLVDEDILETILNTADIHDTDTVVEIGPGIGVLTSELLKLAKEVIAIEFDERVIPLLKTYIQSNNDKFNNLTIIRDNALHTPLPTSPYKIVANIPYHITSPLLRHVFLESPVAPMTMTLLIQREVAENICDAGNAGMLTILVALFGKPSIACRVPPKSFLPPPKVDSAVLHIDCFPEPLADKETIEQIFKLTRIAFGQKRKMLRNTLGAFPALVERLEAASISQERRPQTLSIKEWIAIAKPA
ncbi:MAG: rRNA (adenine1518-N6/adenine1519-N6)-dimethyltransferase [Candidatus Peribacteria bacterium]|nr:rRNA (adenine1518-N6/adenine1519-N6)-dimethyltransferase [Candidatus Peribacteria bacterium]